MIHYFLYLQCAHCKDKEAQQRRRKYKHEKISIIALQHKTTTFWQECDYWCFKIWRKRQRTCPMHCPTHGQWWSKRSTQLLQMEQCEQRGGLYNMQVSQYFIFTATPFTMTSLVRGSLSLGVCLPFQSDDEVPSSSGSGGWLLRGIIPGSLPDVSKRRTKTWCFQSTYLKSSQKPYKLYDLLSNETCDPGKKKGSGDVTHEPKHVHPKSLNNKARIGVLTPHVADTATTIIAIPLWCEKSLIRCLPTNTQKIAMGARISIRVNSSDLTSGPNTSLPPQKNFCKTINK